MPEKPRIVSRYIGQTRWDDLRNGHRVNAIEITPHEFRVVNIMTDDVTVFYIVPDDDPRVDTIEERG